MLKKINGSFILFLFCSLSESESDSAPPNSPNNEDILQNSEKMLKVVQSIYKKWLRIKYFNAQNNE